MTSVACVGAGLIGRAWAAIFAGAGYSVRLFDTDAAAARRARRLIGAELASLARFKLVRSPAAALKRIALSTSLEEAVAGVDLVQESGPETLDAKKELFAAMDAAAGPKTILASSTSFIVASRYTEELAGRSRCLVAHPVNPPHLVPIVELCPAPWTSEATVKRAQAIYERAGQVPIRVRKEIDGFVLNRLQAALMAEAFRLVGDGVASPQDVDKTMRDGLGLRWSFLGPFETIELNAPGGVEDYCRRYAGSLAALAREMRRDNPFDEATLAAVIREWGQPGSPARIARLTRWRDKRLAALKAHKRAQPKRPAR